MSAQKAVAYFTAVCGWTPAQACGIAANLQAESNFRPDAVGDGGQAFGVAQWHPPRQADFARVYGKSIVGSTLDEQLAFVHWELTHTEKKAGDALRACTTAAEAGACVSKLYERPKYAESEATKRAALAEKIAGELVIKRPNPPDRPINTQPERTSRGASTMDPLSISLVGMAAKLIPEIAKIFGGKEPSEVASRNVAVIERVAEVVQSATGSTGPGEAMDKLPARVEEVKAAVREDPGLMMLVEVGGGVAAARKANDDYMARLEDDEWWRMLLKLVANPALVVSAGGFYLVHMFVVELAKQINKVSPDVVSGAMQSTISLILGAIFGFWLGQTWQQRNKE